MSQADEETDFLLLNNHAPLCPHCREPMSDAWELQMGDGDATEIECGHCDKPMRIVCNVSCTYDTMKPEA